MAITTNKTWSADQAKNLQTMLNNYGFTDDNGNKLTVDGIAGPKTQQALAKMNTYQQHLSKPDASTAAWQTQLNDWGYKDASGNPLKEDGILGPKKDAATSEFENGFFDGFTDGKNQKKTVPTQTFPTMPKASDSQIQAAITPARTNLTDGWGQSMAYTGMGNQDHSSFTTSASKPVQTQSSWITPYIKDTAQDTGATGQNGVSTLDMIARMNKIADKEITLQDSGLTAGNSSAAKQDPGFIPWKIRENNQKPDLNDAGFTPWSKAISGQDSGYAGLSDTEKINKVFNEQNRNAGLDKGKFKEIAYSADDPAGQFAEGASDFFKNPAEGAQEIASSVISQTPFKMHYRDTDDIWYSTKDGVQGSMGYSDTYDKIHKNLGFNIKPKYVDFSYNGETYRFEIWYGSYGGGDLVPGAESGLYIKDNRKPANPVEEVTQGMDTALQIDHFNAVQGNDQLRMQVNLYDKKGNPILSVDSADTEEDGKTFWQFASKPTYGLINSSDMYMTGVLTGKYDLLQNLMTAINTQGVGLKAKLEQISADQGRLTYTYDPNGMGGFGGGGGRGW